MRITLLTRQAAVLAAAGALGALGLAGPAAASAAAGHPTPVRPAAGAPFRNVHPFTRPALPAGEHYVCPAPTRPGQMTCMSIVNSAAGFGFRAASPASAAAANGFYGPSDLRAAYKLTAAVNGGRGRTVAIVDAFSDPKAVHDLGVYRSHYHLPACSTSSHCLRIVNQTGGSKLPKSNTGWALEESLDLDMVSAICPNCHIILVEATVPSTQDLGIAEDTAVRMGARFVSNSWSGGEFIGQDFYNHYFNHPGVVVDFASGDFGYGPLYPTDLQYVTAIGGTTLDHAHNGRGWTESAWGPGKPGNPEGTGSGCSTLSAKASWQRADAKQPDGCLNRTENDVSADANPNTGVAMYDTFHEHGLFDIGGTSAATPIITAIYALAGTPTRNTYPAQYPYLHSSHLFDVTSGTNGKCESFRQYLCHGVKGYDGPTGWGTPDGTRAFTNGGAHQVTVTDPGTLDVEAGKHVSLTVQGLDSRSVSSLNYSASGLPGGLSIAAIPHSTNAKITGTLGAASGNFGVTVTAKDGPATGSTHFTITVVKTLSRTSPTPAPVELTATANCLDDSGGAPGATVRSRTCSGSASQNWVYTSDGTPDGAGNFVINGLCMGLSGSTATLGTCTGSPEQDWEYLGFGVLGNLGTGECLAAASQGSGATVKAAPCTGNASQTWTLPLGPIVAGTSTCLDNPGNTSTAGTHVKVGSCVSNTEQQWTLNSDGTIQSASGLCLSGNDSPFSGAAVVVTFCNTTDFSQQWIPGPGGEVINAGSGRCLADTGNGSSGTAVTQQDCYGETGEVWGLN